MWYTSPSESHIWHFGVLLFLIKKLNLINGICPERILLILKFSNQETKLRNGWTVLYQILFVNDLKIFVLICKLLFSAWLWRINFGRIRRRYYNLILCKHHNKYTFIYYMIYTKIQNYWLMTLKIIYKINCNKN